MASRCLRTSRLRRMFARVRIYDSKKLIVYVPSGYCQQLDTHLETSTVREALLFSAKMRQPPSVPLKEKEE